MASIIKVDQWQNTGGTDIASSDGSTLNVRNHLNFQSGKRLDMPQWTTANRPSSPPTGTIGFNTTRQVAEVYNGSVWTNVGDPVYPDPILNGLSMHYDANRKDRVGYVGNTWIDHTNTAGSVNIRNRNSDWSFATETSTNLICAYANADRPSSSGIDIPLANWWNKMEGTFEFWLRPVDYTGGHGWFVNSDGESHTNAGNWFWIGTWSNSDCFYFRQGNPSTCCNDVSDCSFKANGYYPLNTWQCFTVTWRVNAARGRVYRNGSQIYSRTDIPTDVPNTNPTGTGQLLNGHGRTDNEQFKGYCSMYRYWNRELSAVEVADMFTRYRGIHGI